jgi:D-amino-acid oxidase
MSSLPRNPHVLVVGAGVVGLTTALVARRAGYRVTVVADAFAPDLTSVVAGALWEWPPAVCGQHRDEESLERSKDWAVRSYRVFAELAASSPEAGVYLRQAAFYLRRPVLEDPSQAAKLAETAEHIPGVRHDRALIEENGVSPVAGVVDAYSVPSPMIDTDVYLAWLLRRVQEAGCVVRRARLRASLVATEATLRKMLAADAVVNCTGLGAIGLGEDTLYPLRGALIYVHNDGRAMPRLEGAHCMAFDEAVEGQNMVFIVPRGADKLVLGGLVEPGEWDTDLTLDGYPPLRAMLERCQEFLPVLRKAELFAEGTVRAGLRPARKRGVLLQWEPDSRLLHNVGHGGSGVTLSWGCAAEVVEMLRDVLGS